MLKTILFSLGIMLCGLPLIAEDVQDEDHPTQQAQQKPQILWAPTFEVAQAMAKETKKPILLYFTGSDWCSWCIKMDGEILSSQDFIQPMKDTFIFVKVDFPQNIAQDAKTIEENQKLKDRYKIRGFPTILILDSELNQVGVFYYRNVCADAYAKNLLKSWDDYKAAQEKK